MLWVRTVGLTLALAVDPTPKPPTPTHNPPSRFAGFSFGPLPRLTRTPEPVDGLVLALPYARFDWTAGVQLGLVGGVTDMNGVQLNVLASTAKDAYGVQLGGIVAQARGARVLSEVLGVQLSYRRCEGVT